MTNNNGSHELTAIVFTDIVGFTATMDQDEAKAMTILREVREQINLILPEFNGQLLKEIGDGSLLTFKSAVDAVHATLEIQEQTKKIIGLNLRMGIHLGDVIVEGDDVFGSGVNIASRIERIASSGEICISSEIYSQIKNKNDILAESIGVKSIKGIDDDIEIYKISKVIKTEENTEEESEPLSFVSDLLERRVPHILGFYLAAGWGMIQFMDWIVNRYILSPHLVDFTFTLIFSLIPSILIFSYFRGKTGTENWHKIEKIGIPINIVVSFAFLFIVFSPKDLGAATKTVLIENDKGEQVERVIPKAAFLKSIAIFPVGNKDLDSNFSWIPFAITNLISCDMSQEMFIYTSSQVLFKLSDEGFLEKESIPLTIKRKISKDLHLEYFFDGEVSQNDNSVFMVTMNLHRTQDGKKIATNTFSGSDIFSLVDEITVQMKYDMEIPSAHIENTIDLPVKEITSESIKAIELWAKGSYEFLFKNYDRGISLIEKAVSEDDSFAMAYMTLQALYVISGNGNKRAGAIEKMMEYIYKLPERFHWGVKVLHFEVNKQMDSASRVIEMHLALFPHDIQAHEVMINFLVGRGEFENVINKMKTILEIDPGRHEYILNIAGIYRKMIEDKESALIYYYRYLALYPEDAGTYYEIGKLHRSSDKEKARESFDKVLLLEPDNLDAFLSLIELDYEGEEQIDKTYEALAICKDVKDSVSVYKRIIPELKEHGKVSEMITNKITMLKLWKREALFIEYMFDEAFLPFDYIEINQSQKAFDLLAEYERTYQVPFDGLVNLPYMAVYAELGDGENAAKYVSKTIAWANSIGAPMLIDRFADTISEVHLLNGEIDKAIETLTGSSRFEDFQIQLAKCYRFKNENEKAIKILHDYCDQCNGNTSALYELGLVYHESGDKVKATYYMREFINFYKNADPKLVKLNKAREKLSQWNSKPL